MLTETLARKTQLGAEGKELVQSIVDGVKRVTALFYGLRAFAIGRFDERQEVDMSRIVAEVLRDIGHAVTISGATVTADGCPSSEVVKMTSAVFFKT